LRLLARARADAAMLTAAEQDIARAIARWNDPAIGGLAAEIRERRAALNRMIDSIEQGIAVIRDASAAFGRVYAINLDGAQLN
jgi:DNA-binding MarR family transcriptional regulator